MSNANTFSAVLPAFPNFSNSTIVTESIVAQTARVTNLITQDPEDPSEAAPVYDLLKIDTLPQRPIGTKYVFNNNTYRYCLIRSNPSPQGLEFQSRNLVGAEVAIGITAALSGPIIQGEYTVSIVAPATVTADEYKNRMLYVMDGDYAQDFLIVSHPAADAAATLVLTVNNPSFGCPGGNVQIVQSPYIIAPYDAATNQDPIGVNLRDVFGATGYVWVQTSGLTSLKQADAGPGLMAPGQGVIPAAGQYGRVALQTGDTSLASIGTCVVAPAAAAGMGCVDLYLES